MYDSLFHSNKKSFAMDCFLFIFSILNMINAWKSESDSSHSCSITNTIFKENDTRKPTKHWNWIHDLLTSRWTLLWFYIPCLTKDTKKKNESDHNIHLCVKQVLISFVYGFLFISTNWGKHKQIKLIHKQKFTVIVWATCHCFIFFKQFFVLWFC